MAGTGALNRAGRDTSRRSVALWLFAALVAGCASDRMRDTGQRIQEKLQPTERAIQPTVSAFECGGGSAAAAIALCKSTGGHNGHCAMVAAGAGVTGAVACYSYASKILKRREQLVGHEDQLDAQIHYLQDVNQDTASLNSDITARIKQVTASTDQVVDSIAKGQLTEAQLAEQRGALDNEVAAAQVQVDAAAQELQAAQQFRARQTPDTAGTLDAEIARLQELLNQAQRETSALATQRQRI